MRRSARLFSDGDWYHLICSGCRLIGLQLTMQPTPSGNAGRGFVALEMKTSAGGSKPPAHSSRGKPLLFHVLNRFGFVCIAALDGFRRNGGGVGVKRNLRFRQPCRTAGGGNRRHAAALGVS